MIWVHTIFDSISLEYRMENQFRLTGSSTEICIAWCDYKLSKLSTSSINWGAVENCTSWTVQTGKVFRFQSFMPIGSFFAVKKSMRLNLFYLLMSIQWRQLILIEKEYHKKRHNFIENNHMWRAMQLIQSSREPNRMHIILLTNQMKIYTSLKYAWR